MFPIVSFGQSMQKTVVFFLAPLLLAGCSSLLFRSGEFRITADALTQKMGRRFPVEKSFGGLLDVTLAQPRVELNAEENRLSTSFEVSVKPLSGKAFSGSLKISGRPEYLAESRSLFLREARVDRLRMDNMPGALSAGLAKAASGIAKEVLEDKPLYVFKPEEFTRFGVHREPDRIEVRPDALVLTVK